MMRARADRQGVRAGRGEPVPPFVVRAVAFAQNEPFPPDPPRALSAMKVRNPDAPETA